MFYLIWILSCYRVYGQIKTKNTEYWLPITELIHLEFFSFHFRPAEKSPLMNFFIPLMDLLTSSLLLLLLFINLWLESWTAEQSFRRNQYSHILLTHKIFMPAAVRFHLLLRMFLCNSSTSSNKSACKHRSASLFRCFLDYYKPSDHVTAQLIELFCC